MEKTGQWERVKELFDAALERSAGERDEFLRQACGGDASLCAEVKSLLSAHAWPDDLSQPAIFALPTHDPQPDQTIGPYRLVRKIGEGGMGQVWLAEQMEPLRRQVALKLIRGAVYDDALLRRFGDERQSLALMEHPAIAKVFDAGATPEGQPYFVMEYVPGEPITKYCDRKKLKLGERLELFIKACEGVQHAHQKAILHLDLKPANILVVEVDGQPMPRIIDFGLARAMGSGAQSAAPTRLAENVAGTPGYMSPEQAAGEDVDTRTDVYSLGVVLYELLSGQLPFDASLGLTAIVREAQEKTSIRPSARAAEQSDAAQRAAANRQLKPKQLASALSGDLDLVVRKALDRDRARRYGTPSELAADIQHFLRHEPVAAHPANTGYRAGKYIRRHSVGVAMASVLALLVVGFAVVQTVQLRRITVERDRTARQRDRADRIADFMTGMFKVSDPSEARGNQVTAREILDKASTQIESGLSGDPETQASLMYVMGTVYENLGLYSRAESLLEKALDRQKRVLGPNHSDTVKTMTELGIVLTDESRYADAEKLYREALDIVRHTSGSRDPRAATLMVNLGFILGREGKYPEAEDLTRQALDIVQTSLGPQDPRALSVMRSFANLENDQGHYQEAEKLYRQIIALRRRVFAPDDPGTLSVLNGLAGVLRKEGSYKEAEEPAREALEGSRRVLGPENPTTLLYMRNLAIVFFTEGRFTEAEALDRQALESRLRILGPNHWEIGQSMFDLSEVLYRQGRFAEAEKFARQSLAVERGALGTDSPLTIQAARDLAEDLEKEGRSSESAQLGRDTLETARRVLGPQHPLTATIMYHLALALAHFGNRDEAERLVRDAREIERRSTSAEYPSDAVGDYYLACIAAIQGRRGEALSLLRESVDLHLEPEELIALPADPDLKSLHGDPRFTALIAHVQNRAATTGN